MICLNYSKWSNFKKVISKAIKSCKNSDIAIFDHFADVGKMVPTINSLIFVSIVMRFGELYISTWLAPNLYKSTKILFNVVYASM